MNIVKPISTIMTTDLVTVNPEDDLSVVNEIFETHPIHHIPVVRFKKIVGMVSRTDFLSFCHGFTNKREKFIEQKKLTDWKVNEIMTQKLAKIDAKEPIRTAIDLFCLNKFHALPIMENDDLVGIVTTHDLISELAKEEIKLEDYSAGV